MEIAAEANRKPCAAFLREGSVNIWFDIKMRENAL